MKRKFFFRHLFAAGILFIYASHIFSQTALLKWNFTGANGNATATASYVHSGVSGNNPSATTNIEAGLSPIRYLSDDGFTAKNQTATTLSGAIGGDDYFSFFITPEPGKKISISKLMIRPLSQNRERTFTVFSNINGFSSGDELGNFVYHGNLGSSDYFEISLSGHSNITSTIEFRMYVHGYDNKYESCGFGTRSGDDLIIEGTVEDDAGFNPVNTHTEVQLGIGGIAYWTRPTYANAVYMEQRGWRSTDNTNYPVESGQINENGYPQYLTPGQVLFIQPGQNAGDHKPSYGGRICVTWKGEADIRADGSYLSSPTPDEGSFVDGKRYYDNGSTPNGVKVKIYAINPDNPPTDIKVWLNDLRDPTKSLDPAEQGGTEYLINPAYADLFKKDAFYLYRFMNLAKTNHSDIVNWSDRRKQEHCFRAGEINGVDVGAPYEDMIEMCNEFDKDMWICTPAKAGETFVKNLAKLIDGQDPDGTGCPGLEDGLRCFVEYGNEMGWTYWRDYCNEQGSNEGIGGRAWAGRQAARVHSWFRSIVGADNPQYKYIHSIQSAAYYTSKSELEESCVITGPNLSPSGVPDYIGITSYFGSGIEKYVFDEINYWDETAQTEELEKVFIEFEKRTLNRVATVTGVDFTGGVSSAGQKLSEEYGLPMIAYEGGCGLNLSGTKCIIEGECKLVPQDTDGATCNYFLKDLAALCGGKDNYLNFIRTIHTHPYMKQMFELNMSLAKAAGLETVSQFGDVGSVNGRIDYGYWACVNDLTQDPQDAHRYQFWLEWYDEQKDIREVWDSVGTRPKFDTRGELYPAKAEESYYQEINYGGGDGALQIEMMNRDILLPDCFDFTHESGKVIISGTPAADDVGTYNFMYRVLDADNDPAYAVFTLRVLPAPMDSVFAYDDFGTTEQPLHGSQTGYGFNEAWWVQNNDINNYFIEKDNPLAYTGLQASKGAYAYGGGSYLTSGRPLDVSAFDYLRQSTNTDVIGQTNTTLWFSALVKRDANTNGSDIFRFTHSQHYQSRNEADVILFIDDNGKWALDVRNKSDDTFDTYPSDMDAIIDETFLVVMEYKFGLESDDINVYINPGNLGGDAPDIAPSIAYSSVAGHDISLSRIGFKGYKNPAVSIDDLRFGDTYKAVTPTGSIPDDGDGLTGEYYDNKDFTNLALTRVDATVDFDWGSGSPDASMGADQFSVRWTGQVEPLYAETYTFKTRSDDGIRLWVNGQLIIDNWTNHAPTYNTGTISLSADNKYDIKLEYYENGGGAVSELYWSSNSQAEQIIPQSQLFSSSGAKSGEILADIKDDVSNKINIYPNPADDKVTITIPDGEYDIVINNLQGATQDVLPNHTGITKLNVSDYSAGIYIVKINNGNKQIIKKLVIR